MARAVRVTVVIPTRDRWEMLSRALDGALRQEDVLHEVVVVDDGSRDETPLKLAAIDHPALRLLRHERPLGVSRARNAGIETARGEWVAFLDDDDLWSPRKLRAQLDAAGRTPDAVLAYGTYVTLDGERAPLRISPPTRPERLDELILRTNAVGSPSTFMIRADVLRRIGGFDEELSPLADWDLLIRTLREGSAAACPDVVAGYVEHGENMMVVDPERVMHEFERLQVRHGADAQARGIEFGDLWLAQWSALRQRRSGRRLRAAVAYLRRAGVSRSRRDLARALGVLLGERALRAGRRARLATADLSWLDAYR